MSTCISSRGEYSAHTPGQSYVCTYCHTLDEDALTAELERLRGDVKQLTAELAAAHLAHTNVSIALEESGRYGRWAQDEIERLTAKTEALQRAGHLADQQTDMYKTAAENLHQSHQMADRLNDQMLADISRLEGERDQLGKEVLAFAEAAYETPHDLERAAADQAVIEAAKAWRASWDDIEVRSTLTCDHALIAAVDALDGLTPPTTEVAPATPEAVCSCRCADAQDDPHSTLEHTACNDRAEPCGVCNSCMSARRMVNAMTDAASADGEVAS